MKSRILFTAAFLLLTMVGFGQSIFSNPITGLTPYNQNPHIANQVVDPNISVSGIGRGSGISGNAGADRYNANGWDSGSFDSNDYFTFTITPNPGYQINFTSFTYTSQASGTGPDSFAFRSSVDGYTANIGALTVNGTTLLLTGGAYQNISSSITFRFYAWGASAAGGTFSINDFTFNGTIIAPSTLDFYNLQFPGTASVNVGNNFTAYAKAYEPGITEATGANPTVSAWIGYSSSNTNPSGAGWTWLPATYNAQMGNDDEYQLTFGSALPEGIYYYASRFQLGTGPFTYGGYSVSNGGAWDGSANVSGILNVNGPTTPDYVNLQTPVSGNIVLGGSFNVYAQVYEPSITTIPNDQGVGIQAWIGYSTSNTNPASGGWTWIEADFNILNNDTSNDEYMLDLGTQMVATGTYYYASRFQLDSGAYRYGGIQSDGNPGGFWNGTNHISGTLTVAAAGSQEITVKGVINANPTIPTGDTSPSGTDNTLFAEQIIGDSQSKVFRIQNIGSAPLAVSAINLVGGNTTDFTVTASAPYNIPGGGTNFVDFSITFSPTASGVRSTTVSIANNDLNENPYTFVIQGSGACNSATNVLAPASGPVGTEVTVTATSNNLNGATATINGISAVVTQVSPTVIKVIVPPGATSGTLVTTNSQGCTTSTPFTVIANAIASCQGTGAARTQLFISEVTDHGSGSHSYVEIFNATGAAVNVQNYTLRIHNNGAGSPTSTITLPSYSLANNTAYVVAFGSTQSTIAYGGITANHTSTVSGINDNDNIRLHNNSGTWIDLWGSTTGNVFTVSGDDYYYRRKNTGIVAPSTTWNASDWTAGTPVDYTNVGSYDFSTGTPPVVNTHPAYSPSCGSTSLSVAGTEGFIGGLTLAYQWYVAAPGATTWTAVSNGGVYSGATSPTLSISNISTLNGYQYYAQVRENASTCYAASNATMVIVHSSTWNGSAWSPSPPTAASAVTIAGNYNTALHGNIDACSLTVNNSSTLLIGAGDYVSIQNNLTVGINANLEVANDGSLVMISNTGVVTNNGTMKVSRTTTPFKKYDYTYWSSPMTSANIGTTFPGWRTDYSFTFNTSGFSDITGVGGTGPADGFDDDNNAWVSAPAATNMVRAKGYAIMGPTVGTFPMTSTVDFVGTVNNGIISLPVALSANGANANDDFNLIGNPYPSAVDAVTFINSNPNTSGTLYFWTHNTAISSSAPGPSTSNFITDDYAMFNLSGGTVSASGSTAPTGKIATGQGFFIEAVAAGNITFNNAMRNKSYDNSDFFRASPISSDRIWLNMANDAGLFSQQLIGYFAESTDQADWGYDGIINPSQNPLSFYSLIDDEFYRIQGRAVFNITDVVPLGYKSVAGQFVISIADIEGQLSSPSVDVYLEDTAAGVIHDLKQAPYTFTTVAGQFNDRFKLRYTTQSLSTDDFTLNSGLQIAVSRQEIRFRATESMAEIQLFDILGRIVRSEKVGGTTHTITSLTTNGVYIAKVTFDNGTTAERKIKI